MWGEKHGKRAGNGGVFSVFQGQTGSEGGKICVCVFVKVGWGDRMGDRAVLYMMNGRFVGKLQREGRPRVLGSECWVNLSLEDVEVNLCFQIYRKNEAGTARERHVTGTAKENRCPLPPSTRQRLPRSVLIMACLGSKFPSFQKNGKVYLEKKRTWKPPQPLQMFSGLLVHNSFQVWPKLQLL